MIFYMLDNLPRDIWCNIAQHWLSSHQVDLLKTLASIDSAYCSHTRRKRLHDLIKAVKIDVLILKLRPLDIIRWISHRQVIVGVIKIHVLLTLSFAAVHNLSDYFIPHVSSLELSGNISDGAVYLHRFVELFPNLVRIDFSDAWWSASASFIGSLYNIKSNVKEIRFPLDDSFDSPILVAFIRCFSESLEQLECGGLDDAALVALARNVSRLSVLKLDLRSCRNRPSITTFVRANRGLEVIRLDGFHIGGSASLNDELVIDIATSCPHLFSLYFDERIAINTLSVSKLFRYCTKLSSLVVVGIQFEINRTRECSITVLSPSSMAFCKSIINTLDLALLSFEVSCFAVVEEELLASIGYRSEKALEKLRISIDRDFNWKELEKFFVCVPRLRSLSLDILHRHDNSLPTDRYGKILDVLINLRKYAGYLEEIAIHDRNLPEEIAIAFICGFSGSLYLKRLNFDHCRRLSVHFVEQALSSLPTIREISVFCTMVTEQDVSNLPFRLHWARVKILLTQ